MVIKPNASSASWVVMDAPDWAGVARAVAEIHDMGHDAIVEPFLNGSDVEVPVITVVGEPAVIAMTPLEQLDPSPLPHYMDQHYLIHRVRKFPSITSPNNE